MGRAELLATVLPEGQLRPGIEAIPRIGDPVFTAPTDVLSSGIGSLGRGVAIGHLSHNAQVPVQLELQALLGRHLAVLGATGGGKSWTVARLAEEIVRLGGRLILLDASGEYAPLTSATEHVVAHGSGATLPLHEMSDLDRIMFFKPSSGSQLPKMSAAISSLRLAHALGPTHALVSNGFMMKQGTSRADYQRAERANAKVVNDPHAPFDVDKLAIQIGYECVFPTSRNDPSLFGDINQQEVAYCSTLMTRITETTRDPAIMKYISPPPGGVTLLSRIQDWLDNGRRGILRIDLSDLPQSNYLRELTVNTIGNMLLHLGRTRRIEHDPVVVAIDEAHLFLGRSLGDEQATVRPEAFELLAKEGRKYGISVIIATQRPGDLPSGVLSQMGCMIVHRLTERGDQDHISDASSELDRTTARTLPTLVPGEAMVVGSALPMAIPVRLTPPSERPSSTGPRFSAWSP